MKKMWKKVLVYMLTVTMCLGAINMPVYAEEHNIAEETPEAVAEVLTEENTEMLSTEILSTEEIPAYETVSGNDLVVMSDENDGNTWDQATTENIFEGENYKVTYTLSSYWDSGYNATIKIENTGDSVMENWHLKFDNKDKITNIWNAEISEHNDYEYVIKNVGWNQDIAVGQSVEFGISGSGYFAGFPSEYEMVGNISNLDTSDYDFQYIVNSDWETGYNANLIITNHTDRDLEDWILEFDYDRNITEIWNGVIESHEGNHYVIKNATYNSVVAPNSSVSIGFCGNGGALENSPYNYQLMASQIGSMVSISYEVGDGNITNIPETQTVQMGTYALEPERPEKESNYFMGWYLDKEFKNLFEFESMPVEEDITLYALWFNPSSETDTDNDGLTNEIEKLFGTNPDKEDTDGDGVSDYVEIDVLGTDPLIMDTDGNGISDGEEDADGDGLSNKEECLYNTNLLEQDTDKDELTDYDEVSIHHTNPLLSDTDGDGLGDKSEIRLGTNPNNEDTDGDNVKDGEEVFTQEILKENYQKSLYEDNVATPTIRITAKGDVNERIEVTEYTGHLKGDEREYVGKVIEIENSEMESGELMFSISEDYDLKSYEYDSYTTNGLIICYNQDEKTTPIESTFDEKSRVIKCQLEGDGIYFVVDVIEWMESYGIDINECIVEDTTDAIVPMAFSRSMTRTMYSGVESEGTVNGNKDINIATVNVKGQVDIVFVVDTTGSMSYYISNVKNNIIAFVEELDAANIRSNFALVDYRDITCDGKDYTNIKENREDNSNWFKSAEEFKKQIEALSVNGGGDGPETAIDALEMARQLDMRSSSQKFFILVTDADYKIDNNYGIKSMDEMIDLLVEDEINTSVVSNSYYQSVYADLCTKTGGIFANVSGNFKDELLCIADNIKNNTNNGCWIALNGLLPQIVKLDEEPSITSSADTDKDGLLDNQELVMVTPAPQINVMDYFGSVHLPIMVNEKYIEIYDYNTHPVKEDTDEDGLLDGKPIIKNGKTAAPKDPEPKETNGIKGIWEKQVEQYENGTVATSYRDDYDWNFPELSEEIEGFPTNKYIADLIVEELVKLRTPANQNATEIRMVALLIKNYCNGPAATIAGAFVLNFVLDTDLQAYHSQPDTWQKDFGYNQFYDDVFRIGSFMHYAPIEFKVGNEQYMLWMWKGDYWNLHSGAEIGLYYSPEEYSTVTHYDVVDFTLPMTLSLYSYNSSKDIDTIFSWAPEEQQWWITGFSGQNLKFLYPQIDKMVAVGSINLEEHVDIYNGLKKTKTKDINTDKYLLFDDENLTVWVCWDKGVNEYE